MALVKVLNSYKNPGWKPGDHVEMTGEQLKEWLAASAVEVVIPDEEVPAVRKKVSK